MGNFAVQWVIVRDPSEDMGTATDNNREADIMPRNKNDSDHSQPSIE
jgi:hypothetical protein